MTALETRVDYKAEVLHIENIEDKVRKVFADAPIMVEVARCESRLKQYNSDGDVLRGHVNSKDVGVFQINEYYHLESSRQLGHDIYAIDGNIAYAKHLYDRNGTKDWKASKPCWDPDHSSGDQG